MKFQNAWVNIAHENLTLKLVLFSMGFISLGSTGIAIYDHLKDPLVIDRGCVSRVVKTSESTRDENEVKSFIKEAVSERFDTGVNPTELYMSEEEISAKNTEQKELSSRSIDQVVTFRNAVIQGDQATVQLDRIIGVGNVKSVFTFHILVTLASSTRSNDNPYGLKAIRFQEVKAEEKK